MTPTTTTGLPYPADTEAVQLGAQAIKALADGVDRRIRVVTVAVNVPSTPGHSASTGIVVLIPGLAIGDFCFWVGASTTGGISFHLRTNSICSVAGQIACHAFNADSVVQDPAIMDHYFLVVAHA